VSDIEDALSRLNRLNRALSTVNQSLSTVNDNITGLRGDINELSVVLVGNVVVTLDNLISVELSTIHPDLTLLDFDIASVLHPDIASVLHPDLISLVGRIGSVAEPDTLNYVLLSTKEVLDEKVHDDLTSVTNRLETLRDQIGSVTDPSTLNYVMLSTKEVLSGTVHNDLTNLASKIGTESVPSTLVANVREEISVLSTLVHDDLTSVTNRLETLRDQIGSVADPSTLNYVMLSTKEVISGTLHPDLVSVATQIETLQDQIGSVTEADTLNYLTLSTKESLSTVVDKIGSTGDPSTLLGVLCTLDGTMNTVDNTLSAYIDPKLSTLNVRLGEEHTGLHFDGENDYVTLGGHKVDLSGTSTFTIEALVRWSGSVTSVYQSIIILGSYEAGLYWDVNNQWKVFFYDTSNNFYTDGIDASADANKWTHIVGVYDASTLTIYRNTISSGSPTSVSTNVRDNPVSDTIGNDNSGNRPFSGDIAYVRVYSDALSAAEIIGNYENPNNPVTDNLLLWLKFDELEGTTAHDSSGNGNDGTIHGCDWIPSKGTLGHSLQLVSKDIQSTLHPDLTSVATQIETLQDLIGSEADSSTLVANVREEISVLSTVIHPDLTSLIGRIGSVTDPNTLVERVNDLAVNRIGDVSTADTLNYLIKDLNVNRIGDISTANTLIERIQSLNTKIDTLNSNITTLDNDIRDLAGKMYGFNRLKKTGRVVWMDDFEAPELKWTTGYSGLASINLVMSNAEVYRGDQAVKIKCPSGGTSFGGLEFFTGLVSGSKVGLEFKFRLYQNTSGYINNLEMHITWTDLNHTYYAWVRWDEAGTKWQYLDSTFNWVDVPSGTQELDYLSGVWNGVKLVADFGAGEYVSLTCNTQTWDLSGIAMYDDVGGKEKTLIEILFRGTGSGDAYCWIDDVILTEE